MKYIILYESTISQLEYKVNEYLSNGWQPSGGIAVKFAYNPNGSNYEQYYQAMVRHEAS